MSVTARLSGALDALSTRHRRRELIPRAGLDFASNDYLGLAGSELLQAAARDALSRNVPLGSGGSRLLRGNHAEHQALEEEAALFFGAEAALFMGGGFQANQAIFSTLPAHGDLILHDALVHASAHEGMRLGRAEARAFAHNDLSSARSTLARWRAEGGAEREHAQVWIAVESVYSMEGDVAPLKELARFAAEENAVLVVDEAHATGVFGARGEGLAHGAAGHLGDHLLTLHTCGKGLGVSGGLICGARVMIDTLVNRARPFIFATAPSPFDAALVRAVLAGLAEHPTRVLATQARIRHAHDEAARVLALPDLSSQIIPVVLGTDQAAMQAAQDLQNLGFDIRAIRPPTVARGTARLRVSITGNVTHPQITQLMEAIAATCPMAHPDPSMEPLA
ncbi:8-amino-7-oxononanoate synthase (plasmid) [Aliiroseovarius crassostreae]|uniref:8-amino-7-oxononanoate synthase n=1 Tax=Aliiroseovarius crassostreae TaxID=154981 RepID=UPI0021FEC07D|nr:8-amino-7-oxononanoate synthase [Aliiroseovarius crassostreae]UWQ03467.1 8-amino-7-oxononanoate synthase [Aliiroseovarius crassostreae]